MTKLYDYSILILMEEKRNFLDHEGIEDIFSAVAEVCMKYRDFQEEGHVLCFTWSAVSIHLLCLLFPAIGLSRRTVGGVPHIFNELRLTIVACIPIPRRNHAIIPYLGHQIYGYLPATTPNTRICRSY